QWFFKITKYADRLLKGLDGLDWSEKIKIAQRNWIGRSEGALIKFPISDSQFSIEVFTTRPDTIFGATYIVLGPEHSLIQELKPQITNYKAVDAYIKKVKAKSEERRIAEGKTKTGIELKGIRAVNPATKKEIPVWVADYVIGNIGTGAIMAVPAHDARDFEFAKKYRLLTKQVILKSETQIKSYLMGAENISDNELKDLDIEIAETTKSGNRKLMIPAESLHDYESLIIEKMAPGFWNEYVGKEIVFIFKPNRGKVERIVLNDKTAEKINKLSCLYAKQKFINPWLMLAENSWYTDLIIHDENGVLINSGKFNGLDSEKAKWEITKFVGGSKKTQYRLRDWLISRQRYWGPPIPMIYCEKCALNDSVGQGWQPVPEKELPVKLPLVKEFRPKGKGESPLASVKSFYEVKCPKCGGKAKRETDVSDTFLDSAWYFFRYLDHQNKKQLFSKKMAKRWLPVNAYIGGAEHAVLHLLYSRFITMVFKDMGLISFDEPYSKFRAHGLLISEGAKMSKSKGNVVIPDEYIKKFGADVVRTYLMFIGPFEQGGDWRDAGIMGPVRFLNRVWDLGVKQETKDPGSRAKLTTGQVSPWFHVPVKEITEDTAELKYNTAISHLMTILNKLEKEPQVNRKDWGSFLLMLAPFAPFITEELWEKLGNEYSIHKQPWPRYNSKYLIQDTITLIVQVNGKLRSQIEIKSGITQKEVEKLALADSRVQKFTAGKKIRKIIFVKDKLINFVV
ncbi:MAG: class I tRNA ligase family protein, partial [Candidatus Colwellbacteria bacterium]|nr:class I tRNA ligase family protein [Candidatus Colwellbacteria bacterium]